MVPDDWYFLQFVMISIGVVAKEYVQWKRTARAHIFSILLRGLFLFSVILIATHSTHITGRRHCAQPAPATQYLFGNLLLGLVVQALFSVTLVTLSAAAHWSLAILSIRG